MDAERTTKKELKFLNHIGINIIKTTTIIITTTIKEPYPVA